MVPPSDRRRKADTLVQKALALPPEDRAEFLERNCTSDPQLREAVQEQLRSQTPGLGSSASRPSDEARFGE